jgi:pimeloyl-ACP methyl ester carboxylesterase
MRGSWLLSGAFPAFLAAAAGDAGCATEDEQHDVILVGAVVGHGGHDRVPPDAERQLAKRMGAITTEIPSGHVAMVSHPDEVAQLIKSAAEAVQAAS